MEENQEDRRCKKRDSQGNQENLVIVHGFASPEDVAEQARHEIAQERSQAKDQHVEQSLGARSDVGGEVLVHVNVDRSEEKRVAKAVDHVARDDKPKQIPRAKGIDEVA